MNASDVWASLLDLEPGSQGRFPVIPLGNLEDAYLARDSRGCPVVLLAAAGQHATPGMRLRVVSVEHDIAATLLRDGEEMSRRLSVVRCAADEAEIRRLFVMCVANALPPAAAGRRRADVNRVVSQLIDLFAAVARPGKPPAGLWAELLLIARSTDPSRMLRAWHADATDRHDFAEGNERLEVKATTGDARIHDFSLDQLVSPRDEFLVTVASMALSRQEVGTSIGELWAACLVAADDDDSLRGKVDRLCVEYLGDAWESAAELAFDESSALRSLRLFDADAVPKPTQPPPGVSAVRFRSDLDGVAPLTANQRQTRALARAAPTPST